MSKFRRISGEECIKILCNKFQFEKVRQKGSHVVLSKITDNKKIVTVIPKHPEIKHPTLKNALKLAKVDLESFLKFV